MRENRTLAQLLVFVEIIALVVVVVFAIYQGVKPKEVNSSYTPPSTQVENSDNAIEKVEQPIPSSEAEVDETIEYVEAFSEEVLSLIDTMTVEEKVAQLFIITPDQLTHANGVNAAGNTTRNAIFEHPVGGLYYTAINMNSRDQIKRLLTNTNEMALERSGFPMLLAVEELGGGDYSPVARWGGFEQTLSPQELGAAADDTQVIAAASTRAEYLLEEGFNTVFGPITALTDEDARAYSDDKTVTAQMVSAEIHSLKEHGLVTVAGEICLDGEELPENCSVAIEAESGCVMLSNNIDIAAGAYDKTTEYLRKQLHYTGVIIGEIVAQTDVVEAINQGVDMIFAPADFEASYEAVLEAVNNGTISEETLTRAEAHILTLKLSMME